MAVLQTKPSLPFGLLFFTLFLRTGQALFPSPRSILRDHEHEFRSHRRASRKKGQVLRIPHDGPEEGRQLQQDLTPDEICQQLVLFEEIFEDSCTCSPIGGDTFRVECDLGACPQCATLDVLGQVCLAVEYSVDYVYVSDSMQFEEVAVTECLRYVSSIYAGDVICYEEPPEGSSQDCIVTLNDIPCNECRLQTCKSQGDEEQYEYMDCTNRGGSVYDFCQTVTESIDSPFFFLNDEYQIEFFEDEECEELLVDPPPPGSIVTSIVGDPHIGTFDALEFDCQAAGEFVLLKSLDSSLQVQGRFEAVPGGAQASVTTGVAVVVPDGSSSMQISTPPSPDSQCTALIFTDGLETIGVDTGGPVQVGPGVTVTVSEQSYVIKYDNGLTITLLRRRSASFGCFFSLVLAAPNTSERLIGLFGSPNGDPTDDWTDAAGNVLPIPSGLDRLFEPAYNYCVQNWCIQNPAESIFTYHNADDRDFSVFYKCDQPYDTSVRDAFISAVGSNFELAALCGDNAACLVDGAIGTVEDARAYQVDFGAARTARSAAAAEATLAPTRSPTGPTSSSQAPTRSPAGVPVTTPTVAPVSTPPKPRPPPRHRPGTKGKGKGATSDYYYYYYYAQTASSSKGKQSKSMMNMNMNMMMGMKPTLRKGGPVYSKGKGGVYYNHYYDKFQKKAKMGMM